MNKHEQKQPRFLRQPLPRRLGSIAADLARVNSLVRHAQISPALDAVLEESLYFIEWTAAGAEPEVAAELVDIQLMIALWRKAWPEAQKQRAQRPCSRCRPRNGPTRFWAIRVCWMSRA